MTCFLVRRESPVGRVNRFRREFKTKFELVTQSYEERLHYDNRIGQLAKREHKPKCEGKGG